MRHAMLEMREIRALGVQVAGDLNRFFDVEVRGMRIAEPQGIQHEYADAFECSACGGRQTLRVRDVAELADTEPECGHVAVRDLEREQVEVCDADSIARRE